MDVKLHLQALQLEYDEEVRTQRERLAKLPMKQCQRLRLAFSLAVESLASSLNGRANYTLTSEERVQGLKVGDILALHASKDGDEDGRCVSGVVTRVFSRECTLAVKEVLPVRIGERHIFAKVANDVSFDRMRSALKAIDPSDPLAGACMSGERESLCHAQYCSDELNESQMNAVRACLDDRNRVVLIHGPPGTGKTHTLLAAIVALAAQGKRLLVCAPSNLAIDNIVERLAQADLRCVRLGHPARLTDKAALCSYDTLLAKRTDFEVVRELKQQLDRILKVIATRKATRDEYLQMRDLRKDIKEREAKMAEQFLPSIRVVCTTCIGSQDRLLKVLDKFDIVIVDESSQALEAEAWVPIVASRAMRVILAGDHQQLPPTVSCEGAKRVLERSLFERLARTHPEKVCLLDTQYRMHKEIMRWSNSEFYDDKLKAHWSVAERTLSDLPSVRLIDTAGFEMHEDVDHDSTELSKSNRHEVRLALDAAKALLNSTKDIGIIVPYNGQVALINDALENDDAYRELTKYVEFGTVDGFQGREKDAIIVSMVRSNTSGEIGFLKELRRTNVAVTRARMHLCIVGDSETLSRGHAAYRRLLDGISHVDFPQTDQP